MDGCPDAAEFDFVTIVLHEIGHGLGFLSQDFVFEADEFPGFFGAGHPAGACVGFRGSGGQPIPYIYDLFLRSVGFGGLNPYDALGELTPFPGTFGGFPLADFGCFIGLDQYYLNNDLTFEGENLLACLGGPAQIFAPNPYRPGSSISHFDEDTYPGVDPNALLTPFVGRGQAVHDPGCALAVLEDLGYQVNDFVPEEIAVVAECSDKDFQITDPCSCSDSRNCVDINGRISYFHDVLSISTATLPNSVVTLVGNGGTGVFMNGNCPNPSEITTPFVLGTTDAVGNLDVDFFHASGATGTIQVSIGGIARNFTVEACQSTACEPIPTMSEWGLMIFGLLVMNMSVFFVRRKEGFLA